MLLGNKRLMLHDQIVCIGCVICFLQPYISSLLTLGGFTILKFREEMGDKGFLAQFHFKRVTNFLDTPILLVLIKSIYLKSIN